MFLALAAGAVLNVAPLESDDAESLARTNHAAATAEVARRNAYLQASFDRARGPATLWYASWVSAFGAGLAIRTTLAFASSDAGVRLDSRVGMVTLGSGLLVTLVLTPSSLFAAGRFRELSEDTDVERAIKLRRGEELLDDGVFRETLGTSFIPRVAGIGINVAAGLYLGLGADRWNSALMAMLGGVAVTELKIFTQPLTLSRSRDDYRRRLQGGDVSAEAPAVARSDGLRATVFLGARGIAVVGSF